VPIVHLINQKLTQWPQLAAKELYTAKKSGVLLLRNKGRVDIGGTTNSLRNTLKFMPCGEEYHSGPVKLLARCP